MVDKKANQEIVEEKMWKERLAEIRWEEKSTVQT